MEASDLKISLLFAVTGLLMAQEKFTEAEHHQPPLYVTEDGTATPLDKHLPRQLKAGGVEFVISQDSAGSIRLAAVSAQKDRRVVRDAFEDKSSATSHQATDKMPILGLFEDRRDSKSGMRMVPIRVMKYGEHSYRVIPQHKLAPGEYVVETADGEFRFAIH